MLCAAPQAFQVVVGAGLLGENVNHEIAVIDQNPLRVLITFDAGRVLARFFQLGLDLIGDGLNLAGIAAAANQEKIREGGNLANVECNDVAGLLGVGGSDGGQPQGFRRM